ncbi:capsular biosynthesis protein [Corallincola holothuriorum]|uniref:protein-tyrosine-phosphatase n=1 Tax=Corallincola holothuriorum TaxID=2282215 RepID=A0A368NHX2_9GAMM|nr:CpsB/CapC family capsule biosynthesis tyrosine phosphatase [Corallincola holothuriorum]RCU49473.1 capsular biosynthesis protein [Corallincola holothuriorum]
MIDLHCHLLPGVDDGASSISESLEMARIAVHEGIHTAVATPHFHPGIYDNSIRSLQATFTEFTHALVKANIPLKVRLAGEVRLTEQIINALPASEIPMLGTYKGNDVLLLELPYSHIPPGTENLLQWLNRRGVIPMIAHPERNREIMQNVNAISRLTKGAVLFQLTIGSFAGSFGVKAYETAIALAKKGHLDVLSTDAHNLKRRPPLTKVGLSEVRKWIGDERTHSAIEELPRAIIS